MPYRRRQARRRPAKKMYRKRRQAPRNNTGFIKLVRKCPEVFITNNALAGSYTVTDPTTNMLNASGTGILTSFLGTYNLPFAMRFSLSQILSSGEITGLCDRYMLKKTVVRIYFNHNNSSVNIASSLPQLTYCPDHDDAVIPGTDALREKTGTKIKYFSSKNMVQITLYPKPTAEIFSNGLITAYSPQAKSIWLDSASPNVEHYGLKGVFQNVTLPATANITGFKFDVTHTILGKDFQ